MKRNVDLTRNRDFSNRMDLRDAMTKHVMSWLNSQTPWTLFENQITKTKEDEIFLTGNHKTRLTKAEYRSMGIELCDCCGNRLDRKPWKGKCGLCGECVPLDIDLNPKYKFPWFMLPERNRVRNTYDIVGTLENR
jgi:hypothetical protein